MLEVLDREQRPATGAEQRTLARWSGWGAVPHLFDAARPEWAELREQLKARLGEQAFAAARRTTINAHYTDPAYARRMWAALEQLGFQGGRVLEPGCGPGTFIGLAPPDTRMVGVELDPTTAQVAAALYPQAQVRAESFAQTPLPDGTFDAVIGNVPFADVRLHDPRHNMGRLSLHNHFIVKSLALTRPGGMVAVLTSHFTLDGRNPAARREISELADLVGAVRLPTGAHRRAAGTDVVTDLVILRRRLPGDGPASRLWEQTRTVVVDGAQVTLNAYLAEHPERVLGRLAIATGQYGATLRVEADGELADTGARLSVALGEIVAEARRDGLTLSEPAAVVAGLPGQVVRERRDEWDGHLTALGDGSFTITRAGLAEPLEVPRAQRRELAELLGLRDDARALLEAEASSVEETPESGRLREVLATRYAAYVEAHGPINRFATRATGRVDPVTGEPRLARVAPRVMATLRTDPFSPLVKALEEFDEQTQTATPARMLTERVLAARAPVRGVDSPDQALAVCLETRGRVELETIADLLGADEPATRAALAGRVFEDPMDGELVTAAEYLSGNVREKLEHVRGRLATEPRLAANATALEAVVPADLGVEDVQAQIGAAWIDAETHREFLREILEDPSLRVEHGGGAIWEVKGRNWGVPATSLWGTERVPAPALAKLVLEQRPVQVMDTTADEKRVLNPVETAAAQEKAEAMQERFGEWVWEDLGRTVRLLGEYNRRFNALVLRDYRAEGERLTLPGLSRSFTPREHQRTAVARMLSEPAVGLFHQVGAGKTAEMVIGAAELKRLGMASKPAVVVPNHMLEQFSREWLQLYPQARLLAASSQDLAGEKRREFVARVATNDWDAVILTRSAFERLPVSELARASYEQSEIARLRGMLENAQGGDGLTVKRIEKLVMAREERLAEQLDAPRDPGITFEQTGIDYLIVDEAHDYKNLATTSNIRDAAILGSKRASDLHMKVEYLRGRHGRRVITAATATPIANSITEAHVMQRFLRPDLLRDAGVEDFDAWAATFGQTVSEIEMAPTGGGSYRMQTRFARFQNVPEMLRMWHVFADVKIAEDLKLPVPELRERPDGKRLAQTIVIEPTKQVAEYVRELGERAEQVRSRAVRPEEDNMLKISTDGRKAALDIRMVGGTPTAGAGKLDVAAATIAQVHREHAGKAYRDPATGERSTVLGGLQLVFCDLGTPSEHWNAYDELRERLVEQGVPREGIRFIHEAKNDAEKARLFASARSGQVSVLIGSTQKMGVGTNIQARATALHHLDCPWRPADVEQREGRIQRQGNQNAEVGIYRYVVESSFDAYSWQTVERKAGFISQVMRGRLDARAIDDIGDSALSFSEVKALASGDPLILEKAQAESELTRLNRLQRAHHRNRDALVRTSVAAQEQLQRSRGQLPLIAAAIEARVDTRGELFAMRTGGRTLVKRAEAGVALSDTIARAARGGLPYGHHERLLGPVAELGGQMVQARLRHTGGRTPRVELLLEGLPAEPAASSMESLHQDGLSLIRQLEHRLAELPALAQRVEASIAAASAELQSAREALEVPFKHAGALTAASGKVAAIREQMTDRQHQEHAAAMPDAGPAAGAGSGRAAPTDPPSDLSL